jgi:hypothetical protein
VTEPDVAGYVAGQARLRAKLGQCVPFFLPTPTEWPDVPMGQNGAPLDPTVAPLASGFQTVSFMCSVAHRPARGAMQPAAEHSQIGIEPTSHILVACGRDQYVEGELDRAVKLEAFATMYKIESAIDDQVGPGEPQRKLIFGERM